MSHHRPDLGPKLRRVLADQREPPAHNVPVHSELGAQIRRGFLSPAPGRSFCTFDYAQLEMRLAAASQPAQTQAERCTAKRELYGLIYGGRRYGDTIRPNVRRAFEGGGTRKIAELPRVCTSAQHDPPSMMVYEPGVWEHVCPDCGARQVFTVTRPVF